MIGIIFFILLLIVFGKLLFWAIKAAWGLTKILFIVVFFPMVLVILGIAGLFYIAIPILLVAAVIVFILSQNDSSF